LIDREPLRQPEQRRADEAPILDIRLQRIALRIVREHAAEIPAHEVCEVERALCANLFRARGLDVGGDA
jgi:hypothetical protein